MVTLFESTAYQSFGPTAAGRVVSEINVVRRGRVNGYIIHVRHRLMRNHYILVSACCLAILCAGCQQVTNHSDMSEPDAKAASVLRYRKPIKTTPGALPQYRDVEVFINNRKHGETNGCATVFSPLPQTPEMQETHESTCGHPGAISKVTWKFLLSDDEGDRYEVRRVFPVGEPNEKQQVVNIVFKGEQIVLFEDDMQLVIMRSTAPH